MGSVEQVSAAIIEHGSPTGSRRSHTQTEKAHGGFGENGARHANRSLHDHGLNDVGKNMADDHAQIACAKGSRSFDKFPFACGEDLRADQAGVAHPSSERERQNQIENPRATKGNKGDGEQNSRERKKRIHHYNIEKAIDVSAVVAGNRSDDQAEGERDCDHRASTSMEMREP